MNGRVELLHGSWTRRKALDVSDLEDSLEGKRRLAGAYKKHFLEATTAVATGSSLGLLRAILAKDAGQVISTLDTFAVISTITISSYAIAKLAMYFFGMHHARAQRAGNYLDRRKSRN